MTPPILFVSYYRKVPTGQMGVLKRCVRLMAHLWQDFDVHLLNYGPLPHDDGEFRSVRDHITIHHLSDRSLGTELMTLYDTLRPVALVLGEAPLRGNMRLSHRVASHLGLWQVAVENDYASGVVRHMVRSFPNVDRWLSIGLPRQRRLIGRDGPRDLVPPLVGSARAGSSSRRERLCLIGYDQQTLLSGLQLVRRLPRDVGVDVVTIDDWLEVFDQGVEELVDRDVEVLVLPTDEILYGVLARAHVVFGKAGFQQVVESIFLGARIVCRRAGGGVSKFLLPVHLQPFVSWMDDDHELDSVVADVTRWFGQPIVDDWLPWLDDHEDVTAYAAERLRALIFEGPAGAGARDPARTIGTGDLSGSTGMG